MTRLPPPVYSLFSSKDPAPTEIYTLSLHDALPISEWRQTSPAVLWDQSNAFPRPGWSSDTRRSEEHTSELQSHVNLVCRLLLEKKKKKIITLRALDVIVCYLYDR